MTDTRTADCSITSVNLTPLMDPGDPYQGVPLGLYPGGSNEIPATHLASGLVEAGAVVPRRPNGTPHQNGKTGMISLGPSNTSQEFTAFKLMNPSPNTRLVLIDGAQGGQTANKWAVGTNDCWAVLGQRIQAAGLTALQVQVAWIKLTNVPRNGGWPAEKDLLQSHLEATVRLLAMTFPHLRLVYLSSWVYGGYAVGNGDPNNYFEPTAYEGGFAVRELIEQQLNGALPFTGPERVAPWLAWGPYLWADGLTPRSDGLIWECSDYEPDGQHPSALGEAKVAGFLQQFFTTDPTATPWFVSAARRV